MKIEVLPNALIPIHISINPALPCHAISIGSTYKLISCGSINRKEQL